MRPSFIFFVCLMGLIFITGCHTTKKKPAEKKKPVAEAHQSLNGRWVLDQLNGYALDTDSFDREKPNIEIKTENKMYFGYSGCNRINGSVEYTKTSITFKPGPMTRMACIEGNIETDFLKALFSSEYYTFTHGKLELMNQSHKVVCRFSKVK